MSSHHGSDIQSRIESWTHAVASAQLPSPAPQPTVNTNTRTCRQPLLTTSHNPQKRKRLVTPAATNKKSKNIASQGMDRSALHRTVRDKSRPQEQDADAFEQNTQEQDTYLPKDGRPSRTKLPTASRTRQQTFDLTDSLTLLPTPQDFAQGVGSDISKSPSARKSSPTGRKVKSVDQAKADASIAMLDLASYNPSVQLKTVFKARGLGTLPPQVELLCQRMHELPLAFIPDSLEDHYDRLAATPRQRTMKPTRYKFAPADLWELRMEQIFSLRTTVDRVVKNSGWNGSRKAHERQWTGTTVNLLIHEATKLGSKDEVQLANVETVAVEPEEFRMRRPNGSELDVGGSTVASGVAQDSVTTSRMIDSVLGLQLEEEEEDVILSGFTTLKENERSLNQALSYFPDLPIFLDIEIKQESSARDPKVQLAVWAVGGYKKRLHHKWDTSMPMPGVVISGTRWELYIFYERGSGLIMMGPIPIGDTSDLNGTYEIVYKLNILMEWGITEYKSWFVDKIVDWFRARTKSPDQVSKKS